MKVKPVKPVPTFSILIEVDENEARELMACVQNPFTEVDPPIIEQLRAAIFNTLKAAGVKP